MSRRQPYHEDEAAYLKVMQKAFEGHYAAGTDVWSEDDSLTEAARASLSLWQGQNLERRPHVLDIGCGNGRVFRIFHRDMSRYMGVDLCEHQEWKKSSAGVNSSAEFAVGDFSAWSSEQEASRYDLVLDHGCLHHQHPNDHAACMEAIVKLLAPGGILSLVVWAESWKEENFGEDGRFHLPFSLEQIERMMAEAGLTLMQVEETRARVGTNQYHAIACKPATKTNHDE